MTAAQYTVKKCFFEMPIALEVGSDAALVFDHLKYWGEYHMDKYPDQIEVIDGVKYFYQTAEQIDNGTTKSYKEQLTSIRKLVTRGLVKTFTRPRKKYFAIIWDVYHEILDMYPQYARKIEEAQEETQEAAEQQQSEQQAQEDRKKADEVQTGSHETSHEVQTGILSTVNLLNTTTREENKYYIGDQADSEVIHKEEKIVRTPQELAAFNIGMKTLEEHARAVMKWKSWQIAKLRSFLKNRTHWNGVFNAAAFQKSVHIAGRSNYDVVTYCAQTFATEIENILSKVNAQDHIEQQQQERGGVPGGMTDRFRDLIEKEKTA